jgi:hypothetical protein
VILLARALVRAVTVLLLLLLSLSGLALAIFCIGTGTSGPSLGGLADLLNLDEVRDTVRGWLAGLEAPGSVAVIGLLCGLGAMLLGLLLLAGILVPRRERLVTLTSDERGTLAARRRALGQAAAALVEQTRGITSTRVRVRPFRRTGGRMTVRAARTRSADPGDLERQSQAKLAPLTNPFKLKARVEVARRGARVE